MSREIVELAGGGEAYKCEYCGQLAIAKSQIGIHEATCPENPDRNEPYRGTS
ncbi:hypothetical protein [Halalkalicoccus subterraneus]|uniref:hypothetical protein n=1 Tax=Halalkalicoccus subterraneus TaxID=2675002 RepID=UPI0013CE4672|nr:hypothetical protein [Halalkalicoccus subterraneus]